MDGDVMTPEAREADLTRKIETLTSTDEARGFREQLTDQGEFTGAVMVRLAARMDALAKREGRR
jgi:hypothetical protein